jgi:crotonobetainyl-CoA:carnitine CoA-transferase CaiB-like acyl-CoA transferase
MLQTPLTDLTILDLSVQLPGPYATMLLCSLGARVIKVEPPGGDAARVIDPRMFETLNAGKESIELDLRTSSARAVLYRLAERCDVFVEGFRPGATERLGASYDDIAKVRPDIVYCAISGYGQSGPYRLHPGHDLNFLGVGGGAAAPPEGNAKPGMIGVPVVDLASGTTAALAIVAALRMRDQTGSGCYLDVAMLDAAVVWSQLKWQPASSTGEPTYGVFRAADGLLLSIGVIEDKFWRALCRAFGWEDWSDDPGFADIRARKVRAEEIVTRLADSVVQRPRAEWLRIFTEVDVPAAPVHAAEEVHRDPQVRERAIFAEDTYRMRAPLPLELIASASSTIDGRGGRVDTLLAEVGYSAAERDELFLSGAVAAASRPSTDDEGVIAPAIETVGVDAAEELA